MRFIKQPTQLGPSGAVDAVNDNENIWVCLKVGYQSNCNSNAKTIDNSLELDYPISRQINVEKWG